jgi:hypothetical protein
MGFVVFCIFGFACDAALASNSINESNVSMSSDSNDSATLFQNTSDFIVFPDVVSTLLDAQQIENDSNLSLAQDVLNWTSLYVAEKESEDDEPLSQSSITSTSTTTSVSSTLITTSSTTSSASSTSSNVTKALSTTMAATTTSEANLMNSSANVILATTSSSYLVSSGDSFPGEDNSSRNSSKSASSLKNVTAKKETFVMPSEGPHDRNEAKGIILNMEWKWMIVIVLLATLVIGTTLWLVSRRYHSLPSVEARGDVESGLCPDSVLPAAEPESYEDPKYKAGDSNEEFCEDPKYKAAGSNEDTDSVEIADGCCSSGVVLEVVDRKSADILSARPDHTFHNLKVEVACDETVSSRISSDSSILEAVSPLRIEDDNLNCAVPAERMGSTPIASAIECKAPNGGSDETQGSMGFSLFSFARGWFPTSCRKPMTEGIQNLPNLSRTPSLSSSTGAIGGP